MGQQQKETKSKKYLILSVRKVLQIQRYISQVLFTTVSQGYGSTFTKLGGLWKILLASQRFTRVFTSRSYLKKKKKRIDSLPYYDGLCNPAVGISRMIMLHIHSVQTKKKKKKRKIQENEKKL